jgi:very-short-patch-repair endonuclease
MLIVLGGLPEPQVNYILREQNAEWSSRLDLCYSDLKLIVEYDGRHHAEVRAKWLNDIKRREALERDGWRFVIVTSEGLYEAPFDTLQRVRLALIERGCHVRSGQIPAEWHRIFTSRPVAA